MIRPCSCRLYFTFTGVSGTTLARVSGSRHEVKTQLPATAPNKHSRAVLVRSSVERRGPRKADILANIDPAADIIPLCDVGAISPV